MRKDDRIGKLKCEIIIHLFIDSKLLQEEHNEFVSSVNTMLSPFTNSINFRLDFSNMWKDSDEVKKYIYILFFLVSQSEFDLFCFFFLFLRIGRLRCVSLVNIEQS